MDDEACESNVRENALMPSSTRTGRLVPSHGGGAGLDETAFFELVDDVLEANGRQRLDPRGPQRKIIRVAVKDRVLQILAGAGSGKTEALVWRVLYELFIRGTSPARVMVTTFTRKAATELTVRVVERSDDLLSRAHARGLKVPAPHVHDLRIGTIHSLCDSLLAEFDPAYMESGTQLVDEMETKARMASAIWTTLGYTRPPKPPRTVNRLLENEHLVSLFRSPWVTDIRNWPTNTPERIDFLLALLGQQIETWHPRCGAKNTLNGIEQQYGPGGLTDDLRELARRWEEDYLDKQQVLDFTTLQKRFYDRQTRLVDELDHVFVDEFQDTNPIQFAIHTKWLESPKLRLTVVGDDDQSIYRFRGSDVSCFQDLGPYCASRGVAFRQERLEENWRSTRRIVRFTQAFKDSSTLGKISLPKHVGAPASASDGDAPRLLVGPWVELCNCVAHELEELRAAQSGDMAPEDAAILMFSTSEKESDIRLSAARQLRSAIERRGVRLYNPRNKTAARLGSPVFEMLALISYLIDPVTMAPAGKRGLVMVWASNPKDTHWKHAISAPPQSVDRNGQVRRFPIMQDHVEAQKRFRKSEGGDITRPAPAHSSVIKYLDQIRQKLVEAGKKGNPTRLTLAGLVSRILSFPRYRKTGFSVSLFRQALFTSLLEANIAPSRRTMKPLDRPLSVTLDEAGKIVWPEQYWSFLNIFGGLLGNTDLDDDEVDAFADGAVAMLTFHQAKGLEFNHTYVAGTGREPAPHSVLRTSVFSGAARSFDVVNSQPLTKDKGVLALAMADLERELYVALTRAKKTLTILHDPDDSRPNMGLNAVLASLFARATNKNHRASVLVKELMFRA